MTDGEDPARQGKALGTIPLKQVRVSRSEMDDRATNPMNRLVPYLDLFARLNDAELARLAVVGAEVVAGLRAQVDQVNRGLARYRDLLPRLADEELVRLSGASAKTVRFWRLCQPRTSATPVMPPATPGPVSAKPTPGKNPTPLSRRPLTKKTPPEGSAVARAIRSRAETAPHQVVPDPTIEDTHPRAKRPRARPTPAAQPAVEEQPRNSGTGTQPQIEIQGSPFPGYDYDASEPIPDELALDLPELGDL
jgi:hypothetical protein